VFPQASARCCAVVGFYSDRVSGRCGMLFAPLLFFSLDLSPALVGM
jgi:hypothetical protein